MDRRIAGQGEKCVLLVAGQAFAEIIEKTADNVVTLLKPNGHEFKMPLGQSTLGGIGTITAAVIATKVLKADGTWMYYAPGVKHPRNMTGTQWYTRGGVFV